MRFPALKMGLFLGAMVALASSTSAQNASTKPAPPLTAADMVAQGESVVENGTALSETVKGLIREATENADVMKVTCLTNTQTQIDGYLSDAQKHLSALRKATDAGVRAHEHTMIMVVNGKLEVLGQEAGQCVGKDLYETGTTTVDTIIDTDMLPAGEGDPAVPPTVLPPSLPTLPPALSATM